MPRTSTHAKKVTQCLYTQLSNVPNPRCVHTQHRHENDSIIHTQAYMHRTYKRTYASLCKRNTAHTCAVHTQTPPSVLRRSFPSPPAHTAPKAAPIFLTLSQAHKGLPKKGQMASRSIPASAPSHLIAETPPPRSLRRGRCAPWWPQAVIYGSLVVRTWRVGCASCGHRVPPSLYPPGMRGTHRLKEVPRLVPIHVCPPKPSLEASIAGLGAPAATVIQFSHLGHQERGHLSRKNFVLAGGWGC